MDEATIVALQDRFLDDMEAILGETASTGRRQVVLLSGGSGSFLIVAVLRRSTPEIVARLSCLTRAARGRGGERYDPAEKRPAYAGLFLSRGDRI